MKSVCLCCFCFPKFPVFTLCCCHDYPIRLLLSLVWCLPALKPSEMIGA